MLTAVLGLILAAPTSPVGLGPHWLASSGLQVAEFNVDAGQVVVYLPRDVMGGDRISGSVFAFPKGESEEERSRNQTILSQLRLRLVEQTVPMASGFTVTIPSDAIDLNVQLTGDTVQANASVKLTPGVEIARTYRATPVVNKGGAVYVMGAFDGDRSTTEMQIEGRTIGVLAESPRGATLSTTNFDLGRRPLTVRERGQVVLESGFNVVQAIFEAQRLRTGRSDLRFRVEGLTGLPSEEYPLNLVVVNDTPERIEFRTEPETLFRELPIRETDVTDGTANVRVPVRFKRAGQFSLRIYVVSPSFSATPR